MKNKEKKKELLRTGKLKEFRKKSYEVYLKVKDYNEKEKLLQEEFKEDYQDLKQMMHARKQQIEKVKHQLEYYARRTDITIYFLTFTFDDSKRRKPMIWNTLRKYCIDNICSEDNGVEDYSLNKDYGKDFGRLHGHGILYVNNFYAYNFIEEVKQKNKKPYFRFKTEAGKRYENKVGYYSLEKIGTEEKDIKKLAAYITKLTLHSMKVKQSYISTKKGTEYQAYKKEEALFWRWRRQGIFPSDYEKAVYLPHYFSTSREDFKMKVEDEVPDIVKDIRELNQFLKRYYNNSL